MYHTEVVRDGNREYEERSSSVVSGKCGSDIHKTPDTAVQPEASTQAGLSQTADKKPAVQNFLQRRIRRIRIRPRKRCKAGNTVKKSGQ